MRNIAGGRDGVGEFAVRVISGGANLDLQDREAPHFPTVQVMHATLLVQARVNCGAECLRVSLNDWNL